MPKGNPSGQTIASEKYQKKAGYKTKGFKLKGDIAERFALACEKEKSIIIKKQATLKPLREYLLPLLMNRQVVVG